MMNGSGTSHRRRGTDLSQALAACRSTLWVLAGLGLAVNLLVLTSPLYMLQVYDRVITTGSVETLVALTIMAAAALTLFGALDAIRSFVTIRMSCWLADRLGPVLLESGVRSRLHGDTSGAQSLRDLSQIQAFASSPGLTNFFDAPWTPVFVAMIWLLHPVLGWVAVGSTLALIALAIANELMTRKSITLANLAQIGATQQAETAIRNAEVVRAMGILPEIVDRWRRTNMGALAAARSGQERGAALIGATKSLRMFVQVAILGAGAWLVIGGEITAGAMIAASILLGRALAPAEVAMTSWRQFGSARLAYGRLSARLQATGEPPRTRMPAPVGNLQALGVSFVPPGSKSPVLEGVSLRLAPGEAVAVIGPSAGGKSTLCRLLVGVLQPSAGEIRLDGTNLRHWDPGQLGNAIGYLPQDVELFPGSVKENIARLRAGADDADVVEAAMLAHAHEMIQRLPEGYETQIGDAGMRLSGGQRQRIGLARAVFGEPRLVVLDEPNANLDQAGEAALAAAIADLKARGSALLIVGHRPSTLAQADKVLVLKDGRVEIFGPREDVLRRLREAAEGAATRTIRANQKPRATTTDPALPRIAPVEEELDPGRRRSAAE